MKRIYIAGKVSGLEPEVYRKNFADIAAKLEDENCIAINPVKEVESGAFYEWCVDNGFPYDADLQNYDTIMQYCIHLLTTCHEVHFMANWIDSKGALKEHSIARTMNMNRFFHDKRLK